MKMDSRETAKFALLIAKEINHEANKYQEKSDNRSIKKSFTVDRKDILMALENISPNLANSYAQVKQDIQDLDRRSWAGTAHEIREILATLLRKLAPDTEVKSQHWYKKESEKDIPTQKQRVRYILQKRNGGSTQREVVEKIDILDEMIGGLVRSTYSRASDAAHTYEQLKEVKRILAYFEAFAQDLLDL